ncbi:MAG: polysaccharide pyruvyl transferase family protein [Candidatus Helarchaeota archaeon]
MLRVDNNRIYKNYNEIIKTIRKAGKKVYILRHSEEDFYICSNMKKSFFDDDNVVLISDNMDTIELEDIIKHFNFIIGSRYHSIINAYKNGIPAVVIGWANKYIELLKYFDQENYVFVVKKDMNESKLLNSVEKMIRSYPEERNKIILKLNNLEQNVVFKEMDRFR